MFNRATPIMDLPLSTRTKNALFHCGEFHTVGELVDYWNDNGDAGLLRTPNLGKKGWAELKALLSPVNVPLPEPDEFLEWCLRNRRALMMLRDACKNP